MTSMSSIASETGDLGYSGHMDFTVRMSQIQYAFVDDPRKAALDADGLVSELLQSFAEEMARRREELAAEPGAANAPATEQLRNAVRRYRDFVEAMTRATTGIDGSDGSDDDRFNEPVEAGDGSGEANRSDEAAGSSEADEAEYARELEPLELEPQEREPLELEPLELEPLELEPQELGPLEQEPPKDDPDPRPERP